MQIYKEKANLLREAMKNNKAKLYTVINHPLASQEEYYRDLYLKMLCLIAHYSDGINNSQLFLLQRLILGVTQDTSAQEYIRRATEADENFLEDFIDGFKTEELKFAFVVDSLVLSALGNQDTNGQLQFIAELSEQLRITASEIKYLALLAQSIIEQNQDKFNSADEARPVNISSEMFHYYTKAYVQVFISTREDRFSMSFQERTLYNFDQKADHYLGPTSMLMRKSYIYLENMIINTKDFQLAFVGCEKIELINCEFIGSGNSIHFKYCKEIRLEGCTFRDFKERSLILEEVTEIKLISCDFNQCVHNYSRSSGDWEKLGGVIYSQNPSEIQHLFIEQCSFKDCGGVNDRYYFSSAIISNINGRVTDSKFINCWNYHNNDECDPENPLRTLFPVSSLSKNNRFTGSAKFS
ncbi:hypothetical protein [Paenibacillus sp.]|uniref:hypothetical protein n=1 Tax=Paenibacillus sp. TaxID=58172 RepID=UPI0028B1447C|nr:hypothetical protein [Paenibacillus sp.]